jgi:hypothetical protein
MGVREAMLTIGITYLLCVANIPVAIGFMGLVEEGELPTLSQIWNYSTRTLTNLDNTRASKIDNLDASISSVLTAIDGIEVGEGGATASDIWGYETRTLTSGLGNLDTTVSSRATQSSVDTIDDYIDTEIGTLQTDITAIKGYVDTEIGTLQTDITAIKGYVDTEIGTLQTTLNSQTAIAYNSLETYTTVNPVQNQWVTAFDSSSTHGIVIALSLTNGDTATKQFDIKLTIDGVAFTLSSKSLTSGLTSYIYITGYLDDTLDSGSALKSFTNNLYWNVYYNTSLKLEYRTISTDVDSMTVKFRRAD